MNNAPIGVFDSGMGGLTVWRELRRKLPNESLVYYGDGLHCPYGPKTKEEVVKYVDEGVGFLIRGGAKMVVVACNAATSAAIGFLRDKYDIPIVGLEPAVKPAAMNSRSGVIGILATATALAGPQFSASVAKYGNMVKIIPAVGEGFVEIVEQDRENTPEAFKIVHDIIEPMISAGADYLVLGCTHYPFLSGVMKKIIGERDVRLLDPSPAIERRVESLLEEYSLASGDDHKPEYTFYSAADDKYVRKLQAKSVVAMNMQD